MFFLANVVCTNCIAQQIKRELITEKDGFQYYRLISQNGYWGAESLDGKILVPLSDNNTVLIMYDGLFMGEIKSVKGNLCNVYNKAGKQIAHAKKAVWMYIEDGDYYDYSEGDFAGILNGKGEMVISPGKKYEYSFYRNGYFFMKKGNFRAIYDKSGSLIIPESRQYTSIYDVTSDDGVKYFVFEKNGKSGACDINGNEVLSPEVVGRCVGYINYDKNRGFFYNEDNTITYCNVKIPEKRNIAVSKPSRTNESILTYNTVSNTQNQSDLPFPGYTRVAGGLPQVGEKRYWHKSGTLAYCSVECYKDNNGSVLYNFYPAPMDVQHPLVRYIYRSEENGWYIFRRVSIRVVQNFAAYPQIVFNTFYDPLDGQMMISTDGNSIIDMNNNHFDVPITAETADLIVKKQNEFIARGIGAGAITIDNQPSEIEQQLKEEINALDKKANDRRQKQIDQSTKRAEHLRGHRTIRYNSTNSSSTKSVWCSICKRYDKPHTHPVNDGRH